MATRVRLCAAWLALSDVIVDVTTATTDGLRTLNNVRRWRHACGRMLGCNMSSGRHGTGSLFWPGDPETRRPASMSRRKLVLTDLKQRNRNWDEGGGVSGKYPSHLEKDKWDRCAVLSVVMRRAGWRSFDKEGLFAEKNRFPVTVMLVHAHFAKLSSYRCCWRRGECKWVDMVASARSETSLCFSLRRLRRKRMLRVQTLK